MSKEIVIKSETDLKVFLHQNYMNQIKNFFGDEKQAMKFLSSVMADVQKTPKLLECAPISIVNSYMTMAQLGLMPSGVSGEAYVLPYKIKEVMTAQFQLGYQGLVTLFYRAGVRSIVSEVVFANDKFSVKNGEISHEYDAFSDNRGKAKGAYVIVELQAGGKVSKIMSEKEILDIAMKFSKSYKSFGPWTEGQDPQKWMWKKTVLKQAAKLVPKNETIFKAIAEDNEDSIIGDRLESANKESEGLKMGNLLENGNQKTKESEVPTAGTSSDQENKG